MGPRLRGDGAAEMLKSQQQLPKTESSGLAARRLAAYLLRAVLRSGSLSTMRSPPPARKPHSHGIEARDRAFSHAIAATALRRLGTGRGSARPLSAKGAARRCLRGAFILIVGATQLAFMEVAPHAAISLAVEQAKASRGAQRYSGLINAVLRKAGANAAEVLAGQDAGQLNTPAWLFDRWVHQYGEETAREIAAAHLETPALDLSIKTEAAEWAARLGGALLPWGTVRLSHKGRIEDIEGYAEGAWWVQDAAAALPALLLGDVRGLRVADLCAAPGGKTAELAALARM